MKINILKVTKQNHANCHNVPLSSMTDARSCEPITSHQTMEQSRQESHPESDDWSLAEGGFQEGTNFLPSQTLEVRLGVRRHFFFVAVCSCSCSV